MRTTGLRAMVVDASRPSRALLTAMLRHLDVAVEHELVDGAEAMAILARGAAVDLVLADRSTSGPGGVDLVRWIRTAEHLRDLPVVVVGTGSGPEREPARASAAEAGPAEDERCLVKPFDTDALAAELTALGLAITWEAAGPVSRLEGIGPRH